MKRKDYYINSHIIELWKNPFNYPNLPYFYVNNEAICVFSNIEIRGDIELNGQEGFSSIEFDNCRIDNIILNNKSTFKNIAFSNNTHVKNINILNKTKVSDLLFSGNSKIGNIKIDDSIAENIEFRFVKTNEIEINESTVSDICFERTIINYNISIIATNFNSIDFKDKCNIGNLLIEKSTFKDFSYESSNASEILFVKSNLNNVLIEYSILGQIIFLASKTSEIEVSGVKLTNLSLINSDHSELQVINDSKIYKFDIYPRRNEKLLISDSYIQYYNWRQNNFCILNIENCEIEFFEISNAIIPKDSVFQISNSGIGNIIFNRYINTSIFIFSNIWPLTNYERFAEIGNNEYLMPNYKNGNYVFETENRSTEIQFIDSDLGKTSFIGIDFNRFDRFSFANSKILDVFVSGSKLPKRINIPKEETTIEKEQIRLAFGQFKKIYENRGDSVSAGEFHALELEVYRKDLIDKKEKKGEQINLLLNKISNDYGNDWVRAVWVTFTVNLFLFLIYLILSGFVGENSLSRTVYFMSYLFEFLNPIRKDDLFKDDILKLNMIEYSYKGFKSLARFWDYFSRIINAYLVYQTIQAFRRFGKK